MKYFLSYTDKTFSINNHHFQRGDIAHLQRVGEDGIKIRMKFANISFEGVYSDFFVEDYGETPSDVWDLISFIQENFFFELNGGGSPLDSAFQVYTLNSNSLLISGFHLCTIIAKTSISIGVSAGLNSMFQTSIIADGGDVTLTKVEPFINFLGNNGKTRIYDGGSAVLIRDHISDNFYLKGDLV